MKCCWRSLAADSAFAKDLFDTTTPTVPPASWQQLQTRTQLFLEQELQGNLHDPRIADTSYITETTLAGVVHNPVRIVNCAWLKTLNASARNCSLVVSVMPVLFSRAIS